jgi:hypothetical protein
VVRRSAQWLSGERATVAGETRVCAGGRHIERLFTTGTEHSLP